MDIIRKDMEKLTHSGTEPTCPGHKGPSQDLAWLLHRAAQAFRQNLNAEAEARGVDGSRDWIVLSALAETGETLTQVALGQQVGLDKTTLTSILDRLEKLGLVVRRIAPENRRARYPELTDAGRSMQAEIGATRADIEKRLLAQLTPQDQDVLRGLLHRVLAGADAGVALSGSCM